MLKPMGMNTNMEELYLEAEADIKNNNYAEAFKKYESILYEEPGSAPAHNSLGWMYKTQFDDYAKAENHFLTAIRCDALYPHAYFHLAALYMDMERFDELAKHLEKCIGVRTVDKSWVYGRYALMEELKSNFETAEHYFEKAILVSQNEEKIKDLKLDIERCRMKIEILQRHRSNEQEESGGKNPAHN
jgi:tetratricopeptide (TPR) repeat protein